MGTLFKGNVFIEQAHARRTTSAISHNPHSWLLGYDYNIKSSIIVIIYKFNDMARDGKNREPENN
jgi:hypothetical protein